MFQVSEGAFAGHPVSGSKLPPDLSSTIQESLGTEERTYRSISQELNVGPSGQIYLRAHTAPVRNDLGQIMGTVTVLQDISTLKELDITELSPWSHDFEAYRRKTSSSPSSEQTVT
jgi:hypothetical protein